MNFIRLINQGPTPAFYNMALDEAISDNVREKTSPPTLRLYHWDCPSVSIGCFQKVSDVNTSYCEKKGYPVVRRQTGGRAVLHDSELTYSFSASAEFPMCKDSLLENYAVISRALVLALKLKGIEAEASYNRKSNSSHKHPSCFRAVSYREISVGGKKVIGSAQRRYKNGFLQHGSILFSIDPGELCNVLGQDDEDTFNDIGTINDCAERLSFDDLRTALMEAFETTFNVKLVSDTPTRSELTLARELERTKYSTRTWNFLR
jgi:lipoate-protein ligase A